MDNTEIERRLKIIAMVAAPFVALLLVWGVIAGLPEEKAKGPQPWAYQKNGITVAEFNEMLFGTYDLGDGWQYVGAGEMQRIFYGICQDLEAGENPLEVRRRLEGEREIYGGASYAGMIRATNAYCPEQSQNVISGAL